MGKKIKTITDAEAREQLNWLMHYAPSHFWQLVKTTAFPPYYDTSLGADALEFLDGMIEAAREISFHCRSKDKLDLDSTSIQVHILSKNFCVEYSAVNRGALKILCKRHGLRYKKTLKLISNMSNRVRHVTLDTTKLPKEMLR